MTEKLLSARQAAILYGLSVWTVHRYARMAVARGAVWPQRAGATGGSPYVAPDGEWWALLALPATRKRNRDQEKRLFVKEDA